MSETYDAISLGGGLAGCAFALTLARAGRRVAVVERMRMPQQKVCGDFLSTEAVGLLRSMGIDTSDMGGHRVSTFRIVSGNRAVDAPLGFAAMGLSRLLLDETLLEECERAGATVLRGRSIGAIVPSADGVNVQTDGLWLNAARVALATGKHNLRGLARRHGLAPASRVTAFKMTFAAGGHALRQLAGTVQLALYEDGYAGACLVENGGMTVCWLAGEALMRESCGRWREQLELLAAGSQPLRDVLTGSRPLAPRPAAVAGLPFGYMRRARIAERVYPVGDQLAVIPPLSGDGTSIALMSGIAAARAILEDVPASKFQKRFLHGLGRQFRWAGAVDAVFARRVGRRLAIGAVGVMPGLATSLIHRTRLVHPDLQSVIPGPGLQNMH
jgi:flavin-dependent dehydrogenase